MTDHKELIKQLRGSPLMAVAASGEAADALEQYAKREAELVADRERLRDAAERVLAIMCDKKLCGHFLPEEIREQLIPALTATPAQSLAAIEKRVLEEAANTLEDEYFDDEAHHMEYGSVLHRMAAERK